MWKKSFLVATGFGSGASISDSPVFTESAD
jgi:hypothetical protein